MNVRRDTVGIGVIGLGLVAPPHLDGYEQDDGCELLVVCDISQEKTEAVASQRGVDGTTDYHEVLADDRVDGVALLLPHDLHHPIGLEAIAAGKHVCMEKPLTVTGEQAQELIDAANAAGVTLAVAENTRYARAYVEAERMVRSGRLGEIRFVRGFIPDQIIGEWALDDPTQAWKREPHGCGALQDCGPHMFDLLIWYFGEVDTLQAAVQGWVPEVDLDNHAVVAGRMVDGPMFSVEFSSVTEYPRGERVEIYGSDGTLVIDQTLNPPMVFYAGDQDAQGTPVDSVPYDIRGWKAESIRATASDFIDAVRNGRDPGVTAAEGKYVASLVERAYKSASEGGPVDGRP